ncbi:hypothetical protein pb186bvf_013066 [Paramecium bursaria]
MEILKDKMMEDSSNPFLIDGFPRNQDNYDCWIRAMKNLINFKKLIHIKCDEQHMIDRIKQRSKQSKRSDDDLLILKKRFETYKIQTLPIIELHRRHDLLLEVNGNQPIERHNQTKKFANKFSILNISIFRELNQTSFGQTIIETIQIQLSGPEPVENLINILQGLNTRLEGEQERDDRQHEKYESQCGDDIGQLEDVIKECTSNSKLLAGQIEQISSEKLAKFNDMERKKKEVVELKDELQYQTEKRQIEKDVYDKTLDNLEQSLYAVNQVRKMFNSYLNVLIKNKQRFASDKNFLQIEDEDSDLTMQELSKQLNKLKHNVKQEGVNYLIHGLAHITNLLQSDPSEQQEMMSTKVLEIINQIENYIQKQRISEDISEQSRAEAFLVLQKMYEDQIIFGQEMITQLDGSVEALQSQLTSSINEKAEYDNKGRVKSMQLDDREVECRNEGLDYNNEKNKRDKERSQLSLALDLTINKLGVMKKEVLQK